MNKHEDLDLAILSVLLKSKFTYSPTFVQVGKKSGYNCEYFLTQSFIHVKNRLIEMFFLISTTYVLVEKLEK